MINVAAIFSLRNLPLAAEYGISSIFFFLLAAVLFLIPSALVCAELASAWPGPGGLYHWVKIALGKRYAYIAIWAGWMLSIVWFPTILSFCATFLAWSIDPSLADNVGYMIGLMMALLWGTTFVNFLGMRASSWVSTVGVLLGTIFPTVLLILGVVIWWLKGLPIAVELEWTAILPEMRWSHWVFLAGIILSFEGMEITAYHVKDTINPQRQYPKALAISVVMILLLSIVGTLAVAAILPNQDIHLVSGIVQVFSQVHSVLGLSHLLWVTTGLIFLGVVSTLNSWVIGPAKGILAAYDDGFLPNWLSKTNSQDVPICTLLFQAIIGSILICILSVLPSVQSFYWFFTLVSVQLTLVMYALIFIAYIKLRHQSSTEGGAFYVPGKRMPFVVSGIGLISCVAIFFLGFIPPEQLMVDNLLNYELMLVFGLAIFMLPAIASISRQK
tara:strand:+ start:612 stop:1940 length:1329 start_codon:yes stop_codon:yes gene_type:complete